MSTWEVTSSTHHCPYTTDKEEEEEGEEELEAVIYQSSKMARITLVLEVTIQ